MRPTAEHVRAAMLDLLAADLPKARVLDLFAGTGALGLEALSRGALSADFVEFRPSSLHALRANIALLRMRERTRVFKRDAIPFAAALTPDSYDIAFVDPPYESRMLDRVIDTWRERGFSRILAVEHATTHELPKGSYSTHVRRYHGDASTAAEWFALRGWDICHGIHGTTRNHTERPFPCRSVSFRVFRGKAHGPARLDSVDVLGLEDRLRVSVARDLDHRSTEPLGRRHVVRRDGLQDGIRRRQHRVDDSIPTSCVT